MLHSLIFRSIIHDITVQLQASIWLQDKGIMDTSPTGQFAY